ncbi:MAG: hypothetical protein O7A04_02125 [Acidobacteria bacterium]|nr:hypothetical protein [Acidobacteriota bacterium]
MAERDEREIGHQCVGADGDSIPFHLELPTKYKMTDYPAATHMLAEACGALYEELEEAEKEPASIRDWLVSYTTDTAGSWAESVFREMVAEFDRRFPSTLDDRD